jgi:hypothetical protein
VCFDRAPGHIELRGDFRIVTPLQQQIGNLLLSRAQTNRLFLHFGSFPPELVTRAAKGSVLTNPLLQAPFAVPATKEYKVLVEYPRFQSIHAAKWAGFPQLFPVTIARKAGMGEKPRLDQQDRALSPNQGDDLAIPSCIPPAAK